MIKYRHITHSAGHNHKSVGSRGVDGCKEEVLNRDVNKWIGYYFNYLNQPHTDITPSDLSSSEDLKYRVNKANSIGSDLDIHIHFNVFKGENVAKGCEIIKYSKETPECKRVLNKLSNLGFKNRGTKYNKGLYVLKNTKMNCMIIEVCFIDSLVDYSLYTQLGAKAVAKAIVEGILDTTISEASCPTCGK